MCHSFITIIALAEGYSVICLFVQHNYTYIQVRQLTYNILLVIQIHIKLGSWNVRTLIDNENGIQRRTAVIAKSLKAYGVDIAALSETRLSDESQMEEVGMGYTFYWIGKPQG